jgi:hypothetical protein
MRAHLPIRDVLMNDAQKETNLIAIFCFLRVNAAAGAA